MLKQYLLNIKNWFETKPNYFPDSKAKIVYAFTAGGVDYYQFDDVFELPYKRGLQALSVYEEAQMKCSFEYLKAHVQAVENIMNANKFGLNEALELKKLNNQIKQRLEWIVDVDLIYKLAAVVYFDKTERPESLNWNHCRKKIDNWKKHEGVNDFFLRNPIQKLIPFFQESAFNVEQYSQVTTAVNNQHWENIFKKLSEKQQQKWKSSSHKLYSMATSAN